MNDLFAPEVSEEEKTVIVAVKMPKELREQFSALCDAKGISMSLVIRRFMQSQLDHNKES